MISPKQWKRMLRKARRRYWRGGYRVTTEHLYTHNGQVLAERQRATGAWGLFWRARAHVTILAPTSAHYQDVTP